MAEATITNVIDVRAEGNYSLNSHEARGMKLKTGYVTFDGGDYAAGGIAFTVTGLPNLRFIQFESTGGYVIDYDYDNGKIQVWESAGDGANLDEYAAAAITLAPRFLAVGY